MFLLFIGLIAFCYVASIAFGFIVCFFEKTLRVFIPALVMALFPSIALVISLFVANNFTS